MVIKGWYLFEKRNIFPNGKPYLTRYILFECPLGGVYVHEFHDSDDDRALHDHPWDFISVIVKGSYTEYSDQPSEGSHIGFDGKYFCKRKTWSVAKRKATWKHRVKLETKKVWTVMLVSPRRRMWGFWPNGKWCWWRKYNTQNGICENEILYTFGKD